MNTTFRAFNYILCKILDLNVNKYSFTKYIGKIITVYLCQKDQLLPDPPPPISRIGLCSVLTASKLVNSQEDVSWLKRHQKDTCVCSIIHLHRVKSVCGRLVRAFRRICEVTVVWK